MDGEKLGTIIAFILIFLFIGNVIFLVITSLIMRFSHPEFTETQLMISHFEQYWYGYLVVAVLWIMSKIRRK